MDLSHWTEAILMIILFVSIGTFIINDFNEKFSKDYSTLLSEEAEDSLEKLGNYTETAGGKITSGEPMYVGLGLMLTTAWEVIKLVFTLFFNVISGNWIPNLLVSIMPGWAGAIVVGRILQILFLIMLIYAILKLLFRVKI